MASLQKTSEALKIINNIFEEQVKERTIYQKIVITTMYNWLNFQSFNKAIEKGVYISDKIDDVFNSARKNIELYNSTIMPATEYLTAEDKRGQRRFFRWKLKEIHDDLLLYFRFKKRESVPLTYTNNQFFQFCQDVEKVISNMITPEKPKLRLQEIALIYIYSKKSINGKNCDGIARNYGHKSGSKLLQNYNALERRNDRLGESTDIKMKNRLKLIGKVIPAFEHDPKIRKIVEDEYNTLKAKIPSLED